MAVIPIDASASPAFTHNPFLTVFEDRFAGRIPGWIASSQELTWLAPATPPPLTVEKVIAWQLQRRQRFLLWQDGGENPTGYAELNEMPDRTDQMWIGHFVIDPQSRGQALGIQFAQGLVARGFVVHGAKEVLLVVFPDNAPAIRCYERAGFVDMGTERKYFPETGAEHVFLRMGINRSRFQKLVSAQKISGQPLPVRVI